jgi:hypothetical protein
MKGRITAVLAVAALASALLAVPAQAGSDLDFNGTVEHDNSTFFGFDLEKQGGKPHLKRFTAVLAYSCQGNPGGLAFGRAGGSLTPKQDGTFGGTLQVKQFETRHRGIVAGGRYEIHGKLPKHGRAKGTVDADLFLADARGGQTRCYSGEVHWKVTDDPVQRGTFAR